MLGNSPRLCYMKLPWLFLTETIFNKTFIFEFIHYFLHFTENAAECLWTLSKTYNQSFPQLVLVLVSRVGSTHPWKPVLAKTSYWPHLGIKYMHLIGMSWRKQAKTTVYLYQWLAKVIKGILYRLHGPWHDKTPSKWS